MTATSGRIGLCLGKITAVERSIAKLSGLAIYMSAETVYLIDLWYDFSFRE
ncbi:hypothetical protein QWZ13_08775 [Reinekea marina]|uniref:hypothetical protein n=1 Tax=Reinekea marina TaxID=1310421 RepID=UPI0025B3595D|nr:hypothetical protein [Reinekea marina]MDN3649003.1 hypothetical protein [Reinekea marina]